MVRRFLALITAGALLSACGGGSHSILPGGGGKTPQSGMLKITFTLPSPTRSAKAIARGRHYISYSTSGLTLVAANAPTTPAVPASGAVINAGSTSGESYDISEATGTGNGKNCTNIGSGPARTCTVSVPASAGEYNTVATFWDAVPADSQHAPTGSVLSQSPVVQTAIVSGQNNTLSYTFSPEVSSAQVNLSNSTLAYSVGGSSTSAHVVLLDKDGNVVVDDGTGNALTDATGAALTLTLSATNTTSAVGGCTAAGATTFTDASAWVTSGTGTGTLTFSKIPTDSPTVTYAGNCLLYSTIAVKNTVPTTLASTLLRVSGLSQEVAATGLTNVWEAAAASDGRMDVVGTNGTTAEIEAFTPATAPTPSASTSLGASLTPQAVLQSTASDGNLWVALNNSVTPLQEVVPVAPATLVAGTACTLNNLQANYGIGGMTQDASGNLWITNQGSSNGGNQLFKATNTCSGASGVNSFSTALGAPAAPTLGCIASAGAPGGTFYVQIAWYDAAGASAGSTEVNDAVTPCAANSALTVNLTALAPAAATAWNVYVGTVSGGEALQNGGCYGTTAGCPGAGASGTQIPIADTFWTEAAAGLSGSGGPNAAASDASAGNNSQHIVYNATDGNLWYTQFSSSTIAVTSTSGFLQHEYATATPAAGPGALAVYDATHLVYAEAGVSRVAVVNTATGVSTDCALTSGYAPTSGGNITGGIVVGADGDVYFSETSGTTAAIGQWVIGSGAAPSCTINNIPLGISASSLPFGLATDTNGGNIWIAEEAAGNVARFTLP